MWGKETEKKRWCLFAPAVTRGIHLGDFVSLLNGVSQDFLLWVQIWQNILRAAPRITKSSRIFSYV